MISIGYAGNLNFEINGIKDDVRKNVELRLELLQKSYEGETIDEKIRAFYRQAPAEIRKAMQPYGFFKPTIHSQLHKDKTTTVVFNIDTGEPLRVSQIEIKVVGVGKHNSKLQKFIKEFPIQPGEIFQSEIYEKAKANLFQIANDQGFLKASLELNKVLIDLKAYQAKIILILQTGPRYYFGVVSFDENAYADSFLRRLISFKTDEPFSSKKLLDLQQSLINSYYFRQVFITPDFDHAENYRVPIRVSLSVPKAKRFNIGVGYGSFTGPRLTAGVSLRRITDTGQHFDAQLKLSSVITGLAAKYYIPGKNPLTDQWILGANYQKFSPKNGSSESRSLSAGYSTNTKHFQISTNLNLLHERYSVNNLPKHTSNLLYPNLNLTYTKADDLLNPHFGKSINLSLQGASKNIFSTVSFLQSEIKGKYIFSPTDFSRIILRGDFGYTIVNDIKELPLSMRFFAGGLNTVRGYADSSIGPGRYLEVGSIEYQNHLVGNWSGALFYDLGAATNDFNRHFKNGKGVGVIYDSFIGPIKVYVAKGDKYGVEFSIGPEF